jgi:hypothetical protein
MNGYIEGHTSLCNPSASTIYVSEYCAMSGTVCHGGGYGGRVLLENTNIFFLMIPYKSM